MTGTVAGDQARVPAGTHSPEVSIELGLPKVDEAASVLCEVASVLESRAIPYTVIGGVASSGFGRPRSTKDIDVLVRPQDADRTLVALEHVGFRTEKTDERWLYK